MGRSHGLSGWCAGLVVAPLIGLGTVAEVVPFAAATAGYALLPDLDHPGAKASRLLGPLSGIVSHLVRALSAALYAATKGPRDEDSTGSHRHASHTLLAALLFGGIAASAGKWGGRWAVLAVAVIALLLAVDVLGDWVLAVLAASGLWWLADTWLPGTSGVAALQGGLDEIGRWIGLAVALGMFVHCLGDSLTRSGCPWLWPMMIHGETWYEIGLPRALRFRTGGPVEQFLVVPILLVAALLLLPGALPLAQEALAAVLASTTKEAVPCCP